MLKDATKFFFIISEFIYFFLLIVTFFTINLCITNYSFDQFNLMFTLLSQMQPIITFYLHLLVIIVFYHFTL